MTTFPKHPATKAAASIADHGRQVTRAHARLDQDESTLSQHAAQITTANANIATNTTAIATTNTNVTANTTAITTTNTTLSALNTRLGGSSQETFLGTLVQANAPGSASHTGIGTITGTPTDTEFNAVNSDVNDLADLLNALIGRLQASNILT